MSQEISPQKALIYLMVLVSAADADMTDAELLTIGEIVRKFPVFHGFDVDSLVSVAEECGELLAREEYGVETFVDIVRECLPERLYETAYACAVEVAAADEAVDQEELRVLEVIRDTLRLSRLHSGAIEWSARARHMTLEPRS